MDQGGPSEGDAQGAGDLGAERPENLPRRDIATLLAIMAALRAPVTGCPWDLEQDFSSIVPYTIEEAYEVADAIERGEMGELCEELGDLLLQVVYHAQMGREDGAFTFEDVVEAINTKMVRRHPHVFGDEAARSAGAAKGFWEKIKAEERKGTAKEHAHHLDGIPLALPALTRALKLQKRAAKVGFDWPDVSHVLDKVAEETRELAEARDRLPKDRQEEEFGDLMFVMVNLGRHLGLDAEEALRKANAKFARRFAHVEDTLTAQGSSLDEASLEEMDAIWDEVRAADKQHPRS